VSGRKSLRSRQGSAEAGPKSEPHLGDLIRDCVGVSIVIPCLNESRTIGSCIEKAKIGLAQLGCSWEIVVADNASTDGSEVIAVSHGAKVISISRRGYGSAIQGGVAAAKGTFIIMGDGDDSYDFAQLQPFLAKLAAGDDLVMGNRFRGGIRPRAMPWLHRFIGNPVLTGLLNWLFFTPIRDAHCGLRAFRKDSFEKWGLTAPGMEFASEMVVKAKLHNARMSEVPVVLYPDGRDRPPHLRSFRDGWRHLILILSVRLRSLWKK